MSPEQARIVAVVLVALTALLVGFQGASTLVTVTQLGATPPQASAPKSHASLAPPTHAVPVKPVKPDEPMPAPKTSEPASAPVPAPPAGAQTPREIVTDNQSGIAAAAKAKAQAEMDAMAGAPDDNAPPRETRRRYRPPPIDKHRVY
jgi:hypothetical protein